MIILSLNTIGSYACSCEDGYTFAEDRCRDIDECKENPCSENALCTNFDGGFSCSCHR